VLALLLVALGLGLSNFAASVGIGISGVSARDRLRVAVIFGFFETGMPVLGVLLGHGLAADLGRAARWTGAVVLIVTGCYALMQAARGHGRGARPASAPAGRMTRLLLTGAALSIDNLAVGFALGATHAGLAVAAVVIGVVSVTLSLAGLEIGRWLGAAAGNYAEVASGLVLAGAGIAIAAGVL
jgi:manganese efflux pump family protein